MPNIQRLNYFNQQFLVEKDFEDEQKYHLDMRRRHNRLLHTPGIAEGLQVIKTAARQIKVMPGMAIDAQGREMLLLEDFTLNLAAAANAPVFITITYGDQESDPQPPAPATPVGNTRVTEKPTIVASTTTPDSTVVQLARITLDGSGNVPGNANDPFDGGVRVAAGSVLADNSVSVKKLKKTISSLSGTDTVNLGPGERKAVPAFVAPLASASSAFLLVYAFSPTAGARFRWEQEYSTTGTAPNLTTNQTVSFTNLGTTAIDVKYKIYVVLES
ncbi:hypothetical protein H6F76_22165 [Leptolyngbya sp. FACHB-321]|uniref:hypothetical protein n=1 Tax=Leptolyngbya sp. FACHB-321 TaxID=2692807 RepID=UPI0016862E98|nr:hypothetical protein [Leptolyngbya sp. FACHB-321]MBD2037667.1 hypothetical protein [Leptolyngbya sp. FACHB-321]